MFRSRQVAAPASAHTFRQNAPRAQQPHPPVWIFDLDDTLHYATRHVFPAINRSMTAYVAEQLGLGEDEASALRVHYWHRYGATLLGLMKHHGTAPRHFLWHTHQFDDLASLLVYEGALRSILRRLPGRKVVFSNSPRHYAHAVLREMRLSPLFDTVYSIESTRFQPKPQRAGFLRLVRDLGLAPSQCIMVEDSAANLRVAKFLGMHTVLVSKSPRRPAFVDVRIESILDLARLPHRLQGPGRN